MTYICWKVLRKSKGKLVKSSTKQNGPNLTPLVSIKNDLSPVVPLPSELIPEPYLEWLVDIAERMQCPLDYLAVESLIVTASLIGAGCSISLQGKNKRCAKIQPSKNFLKSI
jgi:hypothetical protein